MTKGEARKLRQWLKHNFPTAFWKSNDHSIWIDEIIVIYSES